MQLLFPGPQFLCALGHQPFEIAIDLADLLDHQRHRPVGAPPVAIKLVIGVADEVSEPLDVDSTGRVRGLGKLVGNERVHGLSSDLGGGSNRHRLVMKLA